jgi:steroid 5-alpha reductase family enzyme
MEGMMAGYLANLLAALLFMTAVWLLSLKLQNASIVDSFWGLGFVFLAWLTAGQGSGFTGRQTLVLALITLWGVRLAAHITWRNWGHGEDRRYQVWRQRYGASFWWQSLFRVFWLQAVLLWLIALAPQAALFSPTPATFTWADRLGTLIWLVGFTFEAVADWQLARFKADPANRGLVMEQGLWRYSRHPNYFGETLVWWGIYLIALANPHNWWTVISPVTITFLLLKVSGVTLLEKDLPERRPAYRDYQERTSAFVPWLPKKRNEESGPIRP